jgi:hypothetical protein
MENVMGEASLIWVGATLLTVAAWGPAVSQEPARLEILSPIHGADVALGSDAERTIGIVARSNFELRPAGQCGSNLRCGHLHLKIDPNGDTCNLPGRPYNSMNSIFGGDLIKAQFGHCPSASGTHVVGILLADDHHRPVLVDGKAVTALVTIRTH